MAALQIGSVWANPDHIVTISELLNDHEGYSFRVEVAHGVGTLTAVFTTRSEAERAHRTMVDALGR